MDDIDHNLIVELQRDPRKPSTELAKTLGLAAGTIRKRVSRLIDSGAIILTAIPDPNTLGYPTHAFLEFQTEASNTGEVAEQLSIFPELHYVSICSGVSNIFAWGQFASPDYLLNFIETQLNPIPGIVDIQTTLGLTLVKRTRGQIQDNRFTTTVPQDNLPPKPLDRVDRSLVIELQKNPRRSNKTLAHSLRLNPETVRRRIDSLVKRGAIEIVGIPDPWKMGQLTHAIVRLHVLPPSTNAVARKIAEYNNVHYVGICFGSNRILAGVLARSPQHLSEFVRKEIGKLPEVMGTEMLLDMENLKRTFGHIDPIGLELQ
jgi:DNA-binding Lrp family transcriptional regulator